LRTWVRGRRRVGRFRWRWRDVNVRVGVRKRHRGRDLRFAVADLRLAPAPQVAGACEEGVAIVNVDPDGLAATKGLAEGDVILNVSGKPVSQPSEVNSAIPAAKRDSKKAVLMKIMTAQGERFVAFEFPKA
jgi:serine protease Do